MMVQKTILIVDDEKDLVDLMAVMLETQGFVVMKAFSGEEAITKLEEQKPDIILLDIMMPQMSGYEFCQKIKGDDRHKSIPVILVTAKVQSEDQKRGKEAGADGFITKPYEYSQLIQEIQKLIHG